MAMQGRTGPELVDWIRQSDEWKAKHPGGVPLPDVPGQTAPPPLPAESVRRKWRGAFCIPDALPGIPFGDGKRIWTPAFGCYAGTPWQDRIIDEFKKRRYTHFPYNWMGTPYRDQYPVMDSDPDRAYADLLKLRTAGMVPVVFVGQDDRGTDLSYAKAFAARCQALVPVVVPMWEINGPLRNANKDQEERDITSVTEQTHDLFPSALLYMHFTPGHGSASYRDEGAWWTDMFNRGIIRGGLLSQDWDPANNRPTPKEQAAAGLQNTAEHLRGRIGSFHCDLDNVAFEHTTTATFHQGMSEQEQRAYTDYLMAHAPGIVGFCDGGTVNG
jgi:hypothetical protein